MTTSPISISRIGSVSSSQTVRHLPTWGADYRGNRSVAGLDLPLPSIIIIHIYSRTGYDKRSHICGRGHFASRSLRQSGPLGDRFRQPRDRRHPFEGARMVSSRLNPKPRLQFHHFAIGDEHMSQGGEKLH